MEKIKYTVKRWEEKRSIVVLAMRTEMELDIQMVRKPTVCGACTPT